MLPKPLTIAEWWKSRGGVIPAQPLRQGERREGGSSHAAKGQQAMSPGKSPVLGVTAGAKSLAAHNEAEISRRTETNARRNGISFAA